MNIEKDKHPNKYRYYSMTQQLNPQQRRFAAACKATGLPMATIVRIAEDLSLPLDSSIYTYEQMNALVEAMHSEVNTMFEDLVNKELDDLSKDHYSK